jgi:type III secretion protein U
MSEKTEPPTEKKLRDARERGEVVKSADLTSAVVFVVALAVLALGGAFFWAHLREMANLPYEHSEDPDFARGLPRFFERLFGGYALLCAPVVLAAFVAGVAGCFIQVRGLLSFDPVLPKLERLNPVEGLKRLFSTRTFISVALMIFKVLLLGSILFFVIRASVGVVVKAPYLSAIDIGNLSVSLLTPIVVWAAVVYFMMGAADYLHQHYEFMKQNRMSIDEVKREYRDMEGDPLIKGKRRALAIELSMNQMMDNVRKANVVVVNPTHIAVALYYEAGKTGLPVVIAKGQDGLAARIRAVAEQANIPVLHNVKLARQLYESTPLNHCIDEEFLEPVAEVLRWVKRLHAERTS